MGFFFPKSGSRGRPNAPQHALKVRNANGRGSHWKYSPLPLAEARAMWTRYAAAHPDKAHRDMGRSSRRTLTTYAWAANPGKYDYPGVDTQTAAAFQRAMKRRKTRGKTPIRGWNKITGTKVGEAYNRKYKIPKMEEGLRAAGLI